MAARRAKKGGETGLNGSTYKGGQFLPGSKKTVKGELRLNLGGKKNAPKLCLIEPGKLEMVEAGAVSIYRLIKEFVRQEGNHFCISAKETTLQHYGYSVQEMQTLVDKYNSGERIIIHKL